MEPDKILLWGKPEVNARQAAEVIVREVLSDRAWRGENYTKNWDMYQNRHQLYFKQRLDEPNQIFDYRKKNAIKDNLCGFTVDLSAKYLYGKASKIVRKFSKDTQATDDAVRELCENIYLDSFLLDAAKKAGIYGEQPVRIIPVDSETNEQIDGITTPTTIPYPILMDPLRTFMKRNKWGRIMAVYTQYFATDYGTGKKKTISELIVPDSRWTWETEGTIDLFVSLNVVNNINGMQTQMPAFPTLLSGATLKGSVQNLYRLEDEFVLLSNDEDRKSDLVDIMDLNIALDEALTDKQHFFQKHGWPQMVTEVDLSNVTFSPNKIWEIGSDVDDKKKVLDKIGFLTWEGKMADHAAFVKNLERNIMILSHTAAISTGDLEAIGQLRSGAALITAHSVAIHKTEAKQIIWARNEDFLFKALINMDSYFHNESVLGRYPDYSFYIRYPRDFVPGAELERTQIQHTQFTSHFVPLIDILEENYGNLGQDELEAKRDQIMQDSKDIMSVTRETLAGTLVAGDNQGSSGDPVPAAGGISGKSGTPMQKSQQQP